MNTKYGMVDGKELEAYLTRLTNKIFKIIPMQEEKSETLHVYIDSLARELFGNYKLFVSGDTLEALNKLKGLDVTNHETMRSDVFAIIGLVNRARKNVK